MKFIVITSLLGAVLVGSVLASLPVERTHSADLIRAPLIVVGKIETLAPERVDILSGEAPIRVTILRSSIVVQDVLKGASPGSVISLGGLVKPVNPNTYLRRQLVDVDRLYVFFLFPEDAQDLFHPIDPTEFAIEIEHLPTSQPEGMSTRERLRSIAKLNIDSAGESVAERWFEFLGEQFDSALDSRFCLDRTDDPRMRIRGSALAVLCEQNPGAPSLYPKALGFLRETSTVEDLWPWRRRISQSVAATLGEPGVTADRIREWLESDVRELQEVALRIVSETREASVSGDIVSLLIRTENRHIQYDCIKALSRIRDRIGPSYKEFMEAPNRILDEWRTP